MPAALEPTPEELKRPPHQPSSWRSDERAAQRSDLWVPMIAIVGLVAGVVLSSLAESALPNAQWVSRLALWIGMGVPTVLALTRPRPRDLLRFRPEDLIYGLALGLVLRAMQGWLQLAAGGANGFPSIPLGNGSVSVGTWFSYGLSPVVLAPVIEEFFFRGVVLVAVFVVLRDRYRAGRALFAASVVSVALFVITHTVVTTSTWDEVISLVLLGGACAALVAMTGRIWGAVLVHAGYNALFALLAVVGTFA